MKCPLCSTLIVINDFIISCTLCPWTINPNHPGKGKWTEMKEGSKRNDYIQGLINDWFNLDV